MTFPHPFSVLILTLLAALLTPAARAAGDETVELAILGGRGTDPRDHGRPVSLVAGALGVPEEVFREAFTHVHPAGGGGGPSPEEARANKRVLMDALAKYGVTNDRLDQVSNRYRYPPGGEKNWPLTPATATATLRDGKVVSVKITKAGCGYSSPPTITVLDHPEIVFRATLSFDKDFAKNGAVASITQAADGAR